MIDCIKICEQEKEKLKQRVKPNTALVVIQIGNDPASNSYIKGKKKDCEEVGIKCEHIKYHESITTEEIISTIESYNRNIDCCGILVQLPIPEHLDKMRILNAIDDSKDVDGFKVTSPFTSCTPKGIMMLLDHLKINLEGKVVTVLGRSQIVGKPLVNLLIDAGATVINCNSHTEDICDFTLQSDIVVSAVGKPNLLGINDVYETSDRTDGTIVIDVGINRDSESKLCGDCDKALYDYVDLITPVPQGVGLLTRLALLMNVVESSERN